MFCSACYSVFKLIICVVTYIVNLILRILKAIDNQIKYDFTVLKEEAPLTHIGKYFGIMFFLYYLFFPSILSDLKFTAVHDENIDTSCFSSKPSVDKYQDSIAAVMHLALMNKTNPPGYRDNRAIPAVKRAYKTCIRDKNGDNDLRQFLHLAQKDLRNMTSRADIAQVVAQYWTKFNIETVFKLSIQPNYVSFSGPALLYIEPNAVFVEDAIAMLSTGKFREAHNLAKKVRRHAHQPVTVLNWEILSPEEEQPYLFDFSTLFGTIIRTHPQLKMDKIRFVITSPRYMESIDTLIAILPSSILRKLLMKQLLRSLQTDMQNCISVMENYVPHVASILYMSMIDGIIVELARKEFDSIRSSLTVDIAERAIKQLPLWDGYQAGALMENATLSTEPYMLDDFKLDQLYCKLRNPKSWFKQLLLLRRQNVALKIQTLWSNDVSTPDFVNRWMPATSTKMVYSRIGNSLTVPVAAMLRFKYDDKVQFFLELVAEMAHYFQMEYYYWERGVVLEGAHLTEIFLSLINLEYTNWQEYCFDANFLAKDDYTLYLAAEITHRAMIHFEQPPNDTHDYATRIYNALVADGSSISRLRVATAFALHNGIPTCNTLQVLDCFDPVYEVRVFKWIKIIVNKVV